jgi:FkbM family methyltransferase
MFEYLEDIDIYIRTKNKSDKAIPHQMTDYDVFDLKGKTVMDIGANIGVFTKYASTKGSKKIICYEPAKDNLEMLYLNTANMDNVEIHAKAVGDITGPSKLYRIPDQAASNSLYQIDRATIIEKIDMISLSDAITPDVDVIKMDIEGGEYKALLSCDIPDHVKQIIVEFHFKTDEMSELYGSTVEKMNRTWRCLHDPNMAMPKTHTGKDRHTTLGHWVRD